MNGAWFALGLVGVGVALAARGSANRAPPWRSRRRTLGHHRLESVPLSTLRSINFDPDRVDPETGEPAYGPIIQRYLDELADAFRAGVEIAPAEGFRRADGTIRISDGNHRIEGARRAGLKTALVFVRDPDSPY